MTLDSALCAAPDCRTHSEATVPRRALDAGGDRVTLDCPFCQIVAGTAPATIVREWDDAMAIVPLKPVTEGHTLVIPYAHVRDLTHVPSVTGAVMARAAEIAIPPCNIITSAGREATQSVFHLHLHIVPRREDDGLALPWYSGKRSRSAKESA